MNIFKSGYCGQLYIAVDKGDAGAIKQYSSEHCDFDPANMIESPITLTGELPEIEGLSDPEAAIAIHKYIGPLSRIQASDKRLWTTLAHAYFRSYIMHRWEAATKDPTAIKKRWFAEGGSDRTLEEHAIARLWWGAELTYAPWLVDPGEFTNLECDDPYRYTKVLFSLQELIKVTMESSLGRSRKYFICLLDFLYQHPSAINNDDVGNLMAEMNLISGANKVLARPAGDINKLIEDAAIQVGIRV